MNLDDTFHLKHIIDERKDRLPESLKSKSPVEIYMFLKMSIEYAVKMSKLDFNFILPSYSLANNEVQFLIPFYEKIGEEEPSCVIVVSKMNNRWILKTILTIDIAYNNARLLGIPNANWLGVK